MAYAAVVSLMQLLEEYLIKFPCRVLEIEESKVNAFHYRANVILNDFKISTSFPDSYLAQLKEEFKRFTPTNEDLKMASLSFEILQHHPHVRLKTATDDKYLPPLMDPFILSLMTGIMLKLEDSSLEAFMDLHTFSCVNIDHPSATLSQQHCLEFANDPISIIKELKMVITFFRQVALEAISLYDKVGSLLRELKDCNNQRMVTRIKFSADEAGDSIEDFLTAHPFCLDEKDFMKSPATEIYHETEVKNIFDLLKDIDQLLSHTLKNEDDNASCDSQYNYLEGLADLFSIRVEDEEDIGSKDSQLRNVSKTESSLESSLKQEDIVLYLDDHISEIIDALTMPPSALTIVTIAGMGGIGKTTLAKKVFHDNNIVHHFHRLAWINSASNINQVLSHLLHSIAPSSDEIHGQSTEEDKGEFLYRSLKGRKYLIVMDDLWNNEVWDAIQRYLPDDKLGSRILITSRSMEFPTSTMFPRNHRHCMKLLNQNQSWELMEKMVFGKESCPLELVDIGKRIAEKCGGLPLAIVVIASTLSRIPRSYSSWWNIMASVNSILCADADLCLDILALSYYYLPHHLKACFLFMGSFPAHFEIEVEKLISFWIAEGFLESTSSNHPEIVAEDYLEDLINRSLVSVGRRSFDGKIKTCLIHDVLRQLCLREAQKENFMHFSEAEANPKGLEKQRHLIFNLHSCDDFKLLPPLPHLRSFVWLNRGCDFTPGMVVLQLLSFTWLRVLDMYFLPLDTFPEQLLNLINLRYLALNVTYDPDASISRLWKLQTLIINGPWISWECARGNPILLLEWWNMPWLRHVNFRVPTCLRFPQQKHSSTVKSNIQILSTITFSSLTQQFFDFFMFHLKKLGVSETKEDYENGASTKCFENLSLMLHLEILKCSFDIGNGHARSLGLDILPLSLKMLTLSGSCLSWNEMKFLARLQNLEMLKLKHHAFRGPEWVVQTEEVFPRLKRLMIDNTDLVNWEAASTIHFPCLERLVLRSCKSLEKIPCGVGELSVLELIELHYCSESAENSAREYEEQYGSPKVVIRSDKVEDE